MSVISEKLQQGGMLYMQEMVQFKLLILEKKTEIKPTQLGLNFVNDLNPC